MWWSLLNDCNVGSFIQFRKRLWMFDTFIQAERSNAAVGFAFESVCWNHFLLLLVWNSFYTFLHSVPQQSSSTHFHTNVLTCKTNSGQIWISQDRAERTDFFLSRCHLVSSVIHCSCHLLLLTWRSSAPLPQHFPQRMWRWNWGRHVWCSSKPNSSDGSQPPLKLI